MRNARLRDVTFYTPTYNVKWFDGGDEVEVELGGREGGLTATQVQSLVDWLTTWLRLQEKG